MATCPSSVSQLCPSLSLFLSIGDPVSQLFNVRARGEKKGLDMIFHALYECWKPGVTLGHWDTEMTDAGSKRELKKEEGRRENMQTTTEIVVTAEQLFSEMTYRHTHLKDKLRRLRSEWRTLPEGERATKERLIELASTQMLMLRDIGKIALGQNPAENDGNPFGDGDDY
jgi:hypothetical protein